ncbi:MAG: ribonuclease Y [bacterium]
MTLTIYVLLAFIAAAAFILGRFLSIRVINARAIRTKEQAEHLLKDAKGESERLKKTKILEAKDQIYRMKQQADKEARQKRNELARLDKQISAKEANMDRRADLLVNREKELNNLQTEVTDRERELGEKAKKLDSSIQEQIRRLESISGLTREEAKNRLMESLVDEAKKDCTLIVKNIQDQARLNANREAKELVIQAIQKTPCPQSVESTVSLIQLPSDEMKGRIIGREGRNIRAFEMATGVEVIVDDTPEVVLLSCFEPIRREIAKLSIQKLISDGRIHPGRIEDVVEKAREEIEEKMFELGERTVMDLGIHGLSSELVKALGKLNYLMSFGQNLLHHSIEVAHLAGTMAGELGLDTALAKRAGLLHDIGKTDERKSDLTFAQLGADLAKKHGEGPIVQNTILSFDEENSADSAIAVLVQAADQISSSRPGAKRENLEEYVRRLDKLETIAREFNGVGETFALQAGKEIRVIVNPKELDDLQANQLAVDLTKRIKDELKFPGQVKVSVIREFRVVNYAK